MRGKTRRTSGGRLAAAAALAAHLIYMAAAGPASAMQILEAADHGELAAEISATGVNRIALSHDRIRRVIRAPGGFVTEHDPETGELYLRPVAAGQGAEPDLSDRAPVILFIGTEKGFTYRLTLTPSDRDSAQILIRNGAAVARGRGSGRRDCRGRSPDRGPGQAPGGGAGRADPRGGAARAAGGIRDRDRDRAGHRRPAGHRDLARAAAHGACRRGRRRRGRCRGPRRDHGCPGGGGVAGGARKRALGRPSRGDRDRRRRPCQRNAGRRNAGQPIPGRPAMSAVDGDAGAVRRRQLVLFSVIAAWCWSCWRCG